MAFRTRRIIPIPFTNQQSDNCEVHSRSEIASVTGSIDDRPGAVEVQPLHLANCDAWPWAWIQALAQLGGRVRSTKQNAILQKKTDR